MNNRKEKRPLQRALGGSDVHSATHVKQDSTQRVNKLSLGSVRQPRPICCPTCGTPRLFLVRREVFIGTPNDAVRLVQDWIDPPRQRVYAHHSAYLGGGNAVIQHYVCGDVFAQCPAFSIWLRDYLCGVELVYRPSAPDIKASADAIRQAHIASADAILLTHVAAAFNAWKKDSGGAT